jgi:glycosyltransferase involved in cell wall biosynthesis
MAKISVIITTYNGATRGFLQEAIESVLSQTYKDFELIIVDDGSTDDTEIFCEKYLSDNRVKYVKQINRGVSGARNTGLREASGNYICFLDDDDVWLPEKLAKQIDFFKNSSDSELGVVHTWVTYIDENGKKLGLSSVETTGSIYRDLFQENVINALSSVMVKREVFEKVGLFREHMIHVEDIELWFRVAKHFSVTSINEPLTQYRVHHRNKLSECYRKDVIFAQLVYFYAFQDCDLDIDENLVYKRMYEKFARKNFFDGNYKEFRYCCKLARNHGLLSFDLFLRYWISFFPKFIELVRRK